jgi:hypothetical protein
MKRAGAMTAGTLIFLAACGDHEQQTDTSGAVTPDTFPDTVLAGETDRIYSQMSSNFQEQISEDELDNLTDNFIRGIESFEHYTETDFGESAEHIWISDTRDRGMTAHFSEDLTIEGMVFTPVTFHADADENWTENTYALPIGEDEWFVLWGGTNELVNYHYAFENQRYALDLIVMNDGASFEGDPEENDSYFAFGLEVKAPLEGEVIRVENDLPDQTPGVEKDPENLLGNYVMIEHEHGEYSVLAHFKQDSITVAEGEHVETGDLIGLTGNSGNTTEPHIHFHVADSPNWETATSLRIAFENGLDPVRGDTVTGE